MRQLYQQQKNYQDSLDTAVHLISCDLATAHISLPILYETFRSLKGYDIYLLLHTLVIKTQS